MMYAPLTRRELRPSPEGETRRREINNKLYDCLLTAMGKKRQQNRQAYRAVRKSFGRFAAHNETEKKTGRLKRYHPPQNILDTIGKKRPLLRFLSDAEIKGVYVAPVAGHRITDTLTYTERTDYARYTETLPQETPDYWFGEHCGRHVYQQPATRACVSACVGMLAMDHNYKLKQPYDPFCNLESNEGAQVRLKSFGLKSVIRRLPANKKNHLTALSKWTRQNQGVIFSTGGHCMIADLVDLPANKAVIRDPYHGWMVNITPETLLKYLDGGEPVLYIPAEEGTNQTRSPE